ncbi:MAG TPA: hypothetical protein VFF77_09185 [Holophagaceae bacterium]|jgi:hypothetical protein|nr:hypothetical protein [Holophagaceae bacterium]
MKLKKLSLQKDTLLPLDAAETVNIAAGMLPISSAIPLAAGYNACYSNPCATDACTVGCATAATCATNCNCTGTCATVNCTGTCVNCNATRLAVCGASMAVRNTCYC